MKEYGIEIWELGRWRHIGDSDNQDNCLQYVPESVIDYAEEGFRGEVEEGKDVYYVEDIDGIYKSG